MNTITVKRAFQYRLYPTKGQADKLTWTLDRCRELYNAALEERREAYRMCGVSVSYHDQKRQLPAIKDSCQNKMNSHAMVTAGLIV